MDGKREEKRSRAWWHGMAEVLGLDELTLLALVDEVMMVGFS